jgi:hypothetical protein
MAPGLSLMLATGHRYHHGEKRWQPSCCSVVRPPRSCHYRSVNKSTVNRDITIYEIFLKEMPRVTQLQNPLLSRRIPQPLSRALMLQESRLPRLISVRNQSTNRLGNQSHKSISMKVGYFVCTGNTSADYDEI